MVLRDSFSRAEATYELTYAGAEIVAYSYEDDAERAYRDTITQVRYGLALASLLGRIEVSLDDVDDEAAAKRAIASFAPDGLMITHDDIKRAQQEEAERCLRIMEDAQRTVEGDEEDR